MSIATGGIDSQIQDKMDTYRSNPQALQKAVGVTKQTVDIMALQKLISEKNEKAKALMAEAEQNPKTIAEQRQEEAIAQIQQEQSRTLGDLTQQTAGTLNNKAAMQKKNMNRMAQNAGRPKMGGGAGLAGLMGGNRRPPMPPRGGPQSDRDWETILGS
jgi:F0F1-type ATP synthase membrane subunit b/b'